MSGRAASPRLWRRGPAPCRAACAPQGTRPSPPRSDRSSGRCRRRRLEQMAGDELALVDDLLRRAEEGGAACACRARAKGAATVEDEIGVAIDEAHALRRQT